MRVVQATAADSAHPSLAAKGVLVAISDGETRLPSPRCVRTLRARSPILDHKVLRGVKQSVTLPFPPGMIHPFSEEALEASFMPLNTLQATQDGRQLPFCKYMIISYKIWQSPVMESFNSGRVLRILYNEKPCEKSAGLQDDFERLQRWAQHTIWNAISKQERLTISLGDLQAVDSDVLRAYLTALLRELTQAGMPAILSQDF